MICSKRMPGNLKLVVDTSAFINLQASNFGVQIVKALPLQVVTTQFVVDELNSSPERKRGAYEFVRLLLENSLASSTELNEVEEVLYKNLISPKFKTFVDVGEASIIALSKLRYSPNECIPVIDERKGAKFAKEILNGREPANSLGLFLNPAVISALGEQNTCDAIYNALRVGRMNIPRCCVDQVVDMIGKSRAKECVSLPGFKNLFPQ